VVGFSVEKHFGIELCGRRLWPIILETLESIIVFQIRPQLIGDCPKNTESLVAVLHRLFTNDHSDLLSYLPEIEATVCEAKHACHVRTRSYGPYLHTFNSVHIYSLLYCTMDRR
jgi:hypothetical protein